MPYARWYMVDRAGREFVDRAGNTIYEWVCNYWTNAGADNDGNNAANWSLGRVPTAQDLAYFCTPGDGGSDDDCVMSGNWVCFAVYAEADWGGTLDPNGNDITTEKDFWLRCACMAAGNDLMNGSTLTIGGDFLLNGAPGDLINLRGSAGWVLTVSGMARVRYGDISNSDASGGVLAYATDSTDSGTNTGWYFGADAGLIDDYELGIGLAI